MILHHSGVARRATWQRALFALALTFIGTTCFAAASVMVKVDQNGDEMKSNLPVYTMYVDATTTVEIVITGAKVSQPIPWPKVNGLTLSGHGYDPSEKAFTFFVTPSRVGDFVVPAFDIRADDGEILHVAPIKFHAVHS